MCVCDSVYSDPSQSGGEEVAEGRPVWHHALHSQADEGKSARATPASFNLLFNNYTIHTSNVVCSSNHAGRYIDE